MTIYANRHGNSGVTHYELADEHIDVTFKGGKTYRYKSSDIGEDKLRHMISCAKEGSGLATFISKDRDVNSKGQGI